MAQAVSGLEPSRPTPRDVLVIASIAPESGEYATVVRSLRTPVRMAIREINAAGGVGRGRAVRLVTADEGIEHRSAARAARHVIETDHATAIIGPATSTSALAMLDTVSDSALVCSGSNTAAALTTVGPERSDGLYFRTAPPDKLQGRALAALVRAGGRKRISVIHGDDPDSAAMARSVTRALEHGGATVTRAPSRHGRAPTAAVRRALRARPQAVVVIADAADGARVVRRMIAAGSGPATLPVYANDGLYDPRFPEEVDAANPAVVAGITGTVPASDPAGTGTSFHAVFDATGIDPFFSAYYYDCTILTALAAVKAKSDDPKKMAHAFAANLRGRHDCDAFATCKALLDSGRSIHYRGASSRFDRWDTSEPNEGAYDVWSYDPAAHAVLAPQERQIRVP
jgi:branched-chain amino acid transport system substrate-binding protein